MRFVAGVCSKIYKAFCLQQDIIITMENGKTLYKGTLKPCDHRNMKRLDDLLRNMWKGFDMGDGPVVFGCPIEKGISKIPALKMVVDLPLVLPTFLSRVGKFKEVVTFRTKREIFMNMTCFYLVREIVQ